MTREVERFGLPSVREIRELAPSVMWLLLLICAGFAASASLVLLIAQAIGVFEEPPPFAFRTAVKACFFALLAGIAAWRFLVSQAVIPLDSKSIATSPTLQFWICAVPVILFTLFWGFWNLDRYPDVFPDEWHHVIVARNIAVYGEYASGHPSELKHFDWYDSVGPTAVLPVAAALKIGGVDFAVGRIPIVLAYLTLSGLVFWAVSRHFTARHGAGAVLLMALAPGTPFLARSLYGEVPGFLFYFAGLLIWGKSPSARGWAGAVLALFGGVLLGLAAVTKLFLFVGMWAVIGAWMYDRRVGGGMRLIHLVLPFFGVLLPHFFWGMYKVSNGGEAGTYLFQLAFYRHKLMFGLDTFIKGFNGIVANTPLLLAGSISLLAVAPWVFVRRYAPGWVAVYLAAPLFLFWWIGFTPGTISRYSWYSAAIVGMFSGIFVALAHDTFHGEFLRPRRLAAAALTVLVMIPSTLSLVHHTDRILFHDQTAEFQQLAAYIDALPEDATLGTLYYPAQRSLNFILERKVTEYEDLEAALADFDYVIAHAEYNTLSELHDHEIATMGRYRIYTRTARPARGGF
jgi:4-amino-4-deoxy-L-arabinose transferase-like glycosyltransferase